MAGTRFKKDFLIHYYEVDKNQNATPISILNYLEDAAVSHSEAVGLGIKQLQADGVAWVLTRWQLKMDRYPKWNEQIQVQTWPSSFVRFYATREFSISDSAGIEIGRASSLWVFLHIAKKRPLRIPDSFQGDYGLDAAKALVVQNSELPEVESDDFQEFMVRRSDIDSNNHVNNTRYVEWILETVPHAVNEICELGYLEIAYKQETGYGMPVRTDVEPIVNSADLNEFAHTIRQGNSGTCLAVAKTLWRPVL